MGDPGPGLEGAVRSCMLGWGDNPGLPNPEWRRFRGRYRAEEEAAEAGKVPAEPCMPGDMCTPRPLLGKVGSWPLNVPADDIEAGAGAGAGAAEELLEDGK